MAKKKVSADIVSSFDKLNDLLNNVAPDGEIFDDNPIAKIDEWLPTGIYILNAAISGSIFGGLPNRRSLVFAGEEGCLQKDEVVEIYKIKNPNISQRHELRKE